MVRNADPSASVTIARFASSDSSMRVRWAPLIATGLILAMPARMSAICR